MGKIQENDARLQQLVSMARIGWWEVDFDEGVYYCSEFVADLLGIEGNKISAKDFANLICENYRERILEEFRSFRMMEIYEQVFPIHSKYGMMWVSTKVGEKRITKEGHVLAITGTEHRFNHGYVAMYFPATDEYAGADSRPVEFFIISFERYFQVIA